MKALIDQKLSQKAIKNCQEVWDLLPKHYVITNFAVIFFGKLYVSNMHGDGRTDRIFDSCYYFIIIYLPLIEFVFLFFSDFSSFSSMIFPDIYFFLPEMSYRPYKLHFARTHVNASYRILIPYVSFWIQKIFFSKLRM